MPATAHCLVHATAIAANGRAALIMGPSGAGKSTLALRAITTPYMDGGRLVTVTLVADDQVSIARQHGGLVAAPPATIAGKLEVRGVGIVDFPHLPLAGIALAVNLKPAREIERLPPGDLRHNILGIELPLVEIDASDPGATARLVLALLRTKHV